MKFHFFGLNVPNASDGWRRVSQRLSVDLTAGELMGAHVGAGIKALSFLGRSDLHARRNVEYRYSRLGISIDGLGGKFRSLTLAVSKQGTLRPYRGDWLIHGQSVKINRKTTPEQIRGLLYEPAEDWNDGMELAMRYQSVEAMVHFSWSCPTDTLEYVVVEHQPTDLRE